VKLTCARDGCGGIFECRTGRYNRAIQLGAPLYCSKACAGLARRRPTDVTPDQLKAAKAAYDREYRAANRERLAQQKRDHYEANRQRILAEMAEYRKVRMPAHVEYCRKPEYRAKKRNYDAQRNAAEFGEFGEAWRLLQDLEREIRSQASAYEVRVQQGYYTRNAQKRRRELWQLKQRN